MFNDSTIFCKVFVSFVRSKSDLIEFIKNAVAGKGEANTIYVKDIELYIERNDDYDAERSKEFPDGFLNFPYYLEIEGGSEEVQQILVTQLIERLWLEGIPAIAACDYERQLPQRGGYKSTSVPWPE